jgi:HPr kinase/phosphorylase
MSETTTHGALVRIFDVGVLVRGPAGSGKSWAALRLMDRGHRLVSDDVVVLFQGADGSLQGRSLEERPRIEIRGLGVFEADALFEGATVPSAPIDLIVALDPYDRGRDAGRVTPERSMVRLLDCDVLEIRLPVCAGPDIGLLVELIAGRFQSGEFTESS